MDPEQKPEQAQPAPAESQQQGTYQKDTKSYGSKWTKYLLWYIIAAIVIYGIIYFVMRSRA